MLSRSIRFLMFLLFPLIADAANFDTLASIPQEQRVKLARALYKKQLRRVDSTTAFQGFQQLFDLARSLDDRSLEVSIHEFQADYFSVNRGFNVLSPSCYQKAIDLSEDYGLPVERAIYTHRKGTYYNTFQHYVEAYRYFLESYTLFKEVGFENVPDIGGYLNVQATFYYNIGEFDAIPDLLLEALRHPFDTPGEEINILNTLALTYRNLGETEKAQRYFEIGLNKAKAENVSVWIGIISGNLGVMFMGKAEYDKALEGLREDYIRSLQGGEPASAASALLAMAKCYILKGELKTADSLSLLSEPMVRKLNQLTLWISYYDNLSTLAEKKGRSADALAYRKEHGRAKDSLEVINNHAAINRVKLKWEMDRHNAQVEQLRSMTQIELMKRNSALAVLLLLMVISVLALNRQRLKRRKEKELFEKQQELLLSENARSEAELFYASEALAAYTENLKVKNELIEEFKTEIEHLQGKLGGPPDVERLNQLEALHRLHIITDDHWDEFRKLFEKVHTGFLYRLKEKFKNITETDIRLLTLLRLGMNNREMANMLGVTTEAIKKSRQRLKKKIDLPDDQSLEAIVATI